MFEVMIVGGAKKVFSDVPHVLGTIVIDRTSIGKTLETKAHCKISL
jgi:hypothetical protein